MAFALSSQVPQAGAWNPPDGPQDRLDLALPPLAPTIPLNRAHGYIIQNGISILYNDGYWFAAQMLRDGQQELLNGVRYADVYEGTSRIWVTDALGELDCDPKNDLFSGVNVTGKQAYCIEKAIAPVNHFSIRIPATVWTSKDG
jgi:hypothetical protein